MTAPWQPGSRTHYDVLDVPFDAEPDVIRRAYRAAAVRAHPDRNSGDAGAATVRMSELNAAWSVLSDAALKRAYDRDLFGDDGDGDDGDGYGDTEMLVHGPRFRVSLAAVIVVILVIIFVFTAYAGGTPTR